MLHNGVEVPSHIYMERDGVYKVDFTPEGSGSYNVNVYYNDEEVRGTIIFIYIWKNHPSYKKKVAKESKQIILDCSRLI